MFIVGILGGFVSGLLLFIYLASTQGLSTWRKGESIAQANKYTGTSVVAWDELIQRAQRQIDLTLPELPAEVRLAAEQIPCLFQEVHPTKRRVLGVYHNVGATDMTTRKGPIILYLRTIENYALRRKIGFEEQVRATYLHELGHHVGWNEGQVRERGL
ncbi:MAG TPA: metallopeptidase family protein [Candidatus Methylacidiphilales bacterium]|jgi:predicted Zn-dependent protease with MMP-like domain|nr:metallopeptidase family protein [Candidatus Methylacidiphilales bacterium]